MKLLLISHEAGRSGAPILLLSFLQWLARTSAIRFDVLLLRDGPLRHEFAQLGPVYVADEITGRHTRYGRLAHRAFRKTAETWIDDACRKLLNRTQYDGVYGNTILSLPWLNAFRRLANLPCVCHVHEMRWAIRQFFEASFVAGSMPRLDAVIACSATVASDLQEAFRADPKRLVVAESFIDPDILIDRPAAEVRRSLAIPDDAVIVGGVGRAELRKGVDLLVQALVRFAARPTQLDVRVVWVGVSAHDELLSTCQEDLRKLGLADRFVFIEHTSRPNDYINAFDVFAMVSREDPMPLVALAAACLGRPIVTFENAGGIADFVGDDCGYRVPYLDVEALVSAVLRISDDPAESRRRADAARTKVLNHHSLEVVAPLLLDVITRTFGSEAADFVRSSTSKN